MAELRAHVPDDIDVCETRSAGWMFRCHRCDITRSNLSASAAREMGESHGSASIPHPLAVIWKRFGPDDACVEIGRHHLTGEVLVRAPQSPGTTLHLTRYEWETFVRAVKEGAA